MGKCAQSYFYARRLCDVEGLRISDRKVYFVLLVTNYAWLPGLVYVHSIDCSNILAQVLAI